MSLVRARALALAARRKVVPTDVRVGVGAVAVAPTIVAPVGCRIEDTAGLIMDPACGKYPHRTQGRDELERALRFACRVWGADKLWVEIDELAWTKLLRARVEQLVAKDCRAVRAAEITESQTRLPHNDLFRCDSGTLVFPTTGISKVKRELSPATRTSGDARNGLTLLARKEGRFLAAATSFLFGAPLRALRNPNAESQMAHFKSNGPRYGRTLEQRFWEKVEKRGPDECWPWIASRVRFGYGALRVDGRGRRSHRLAYELANGPIPAGLCVLHNCDNAPCCNPAHLRLGTKADNARDKTERGRCRGRAPGSLPLKPACKRGHAFDDANTRWWNGVRHCRTCSRLRTADYRRRLAQEAA